MKHKLNNKTFSNETLEPKTIEIGKIENNIFGIFVLILFIFLFKYSACYSI
tara:strand:+ start:704 stop:856 length:153 start_codon:yes stop_codon:yes gene_type:complete